MCCYTAYKKSLEEAIESDTSGRFCRILVSLVQVTFIHRRKWTTEVKGLLIGLIFIGF